MASPLFPTDISYNVIPERYDRSNNPLNIGYPKPATDADGDVITYSLNQAAVDMGFRVDQNGQITYIGDGSGIDAETMPEFSITLTATSTGTNGITESATHEVHFSVSDIDEGGPVFSDNAPNEILIYEAIFSGSNFIRDNLPKGSLKATDPDNSLVTYSLDQASIDAGFRLTGDGSGDFEFKGSNKDLYAILDWEDSPTFTVTVRASTYNRTTLRMDTTEHEVVVRLKYDHDNDPPSFIDGTPTTATIADSESGTDDPVVIATTQAIDPDIGKETLTYALNQEALDLGFQINHEGQITYHGDGFDADIISDVTITVTATTHHIYRTFSQFDGHAPVIITKRIEKSATHEILVSIIESDESIPAFTAESAITLSIDENLSGDETEVILGSVSAIDGDGDTVSYSLDARSVNKGFRVDDSNGQISYVGRGLNHEGKASHVLTITATSTGDDEVARGVTHEVTVNVNDVEEGPFFIHNLRDHAMIYESGPPVPNGFGRYGLEWFHTPVTARDPEGDTVTYSLNQEAVEMGFRLSKYLTLYYKGPYFDGGKHIYHNVTPTIPVTITATSIGEDGVARSVSHTVTLTADKSHTHYNHYPVITAGENNIFTSDEPIDVLSHFGNEKAIVLAEFSDKETSNNAMKIEVVFTNNDGNEKSITLAKHYNGYTTWVHDIPMIDEVGFTVDKETGQVKIPRHALLFGFNPPKEDTEYSFTLRFTDKQGGSVDEVFTYTIKGAGNIAPYLYYDASSVDNIIDEGVTEQAIRILGINDPDDDNFDVDDFTITGDFADRFEVREVNGKFVMYFSGDAFDYEALSVEDRYINLSVTVTDGIDVSEALEFSVRVDDVFEGLNDHLGDAYNDPLPLEVV